MIIRNVGGTEISTDELLQAASGLQGGNPVSQPLQSIPGKQESVTRQPVANIVAIGADDDNTGVPFGNTFLGVPVKSWVLAGVGLAAVHMITKNNRVGKVNMKKALPLLLVAGAGAWYFFFRKPAGSDASAGADPAELDYITLWLSSNRDLPKQRAQIAKMTADEVHTVYATVRAQESGTLTPAMQATFDAIASKYGLFDPQNMQ